MARARTAGRLFSVLTAFTLVCIIGSGLAWAADTRADLHAEIEGLIRRLGDDEWTVREAAERRLAEIGWLTLPALRQAQDDPDPEVRRRALRAHEAASRIAAAERSKLRSRGRQAFNQGDYENMIRHYTRLAAAADASPEDRLWLGHAYQLNEDWPRAVEGYRFALRRINEMLGAGTRKTDLPDLRSALILLIGRLQREVLKDPQAAARTLAPGTDTDTDDFTSRLRVLKELAAAQTDLGKTAAALKTWGRLRKEATARGRSPYQYGFDIARIDRLMRQWEPIQPPPDVPFLIALSPGKPHASLRLGDLETRARSYKPSANPDSPHWHYAFAPPPGEEFETIEFACDIEQIKARYGGHFRSWTLATGTHGGRVSLGSIGPPRDEPLGRRTCTRRFDVPPGAGLVCIETGSWKGRFDVHAVDVTATFRYRQRPEPTAVPGVWIQNEVLPAGGELTWNGRPMRPRTAHTNVKPGRYLFEYRVPGRFETFRHEADLVPGARYGLFVNLDSPFRWDLTNLRHLSSPVPPGRPAVVRLPDGRWLAAYCTGGSAILLTTSDDLAKWDPPWRLPHAPIFRNVGPAMMRARDGTVWLAWFSNRLHVGRPTTGGSRLWLSSTRDGRTWSPPKHVAAGAIGGWPYSAISITQGPDGRTWMFWRKRLGSADAPDRIRELRPINIDLSECRIVYNPHVTIDDAGRLHLVFDNFGSAIYYSHSDDGAKWAKPIRLTKAKPARRVSHPQLILDGGRVALIHEASNAAYLHRGVMTQAPELEPPIKITNHVIPLSGARACLSADRQVILFAGQDTIWLLRADVEALTRP